MPRRLHCSTTVTTANILQDAYRQLGGDAVSACISTLHPYKPPPLPPSIPPLPLPAPLATTLWPNEKERLDTRSLAPATRPPSYSQVESSPLSPRYTLVMRGQWPPHTAMPSPVSPRSPPPMPHSPASQLGSSAFPSDRLAQLHLQVDVSSQAAASAAPRTATPVSDT